MNLMLFLLSAYIYLALIEFVWSAALFLYGLSEKKDGGIEGCTLLVYDVDIIYMFACNVQKRIRMKSIRVYLLIYKRLFQSTTVCIYRGK